MSSMFSTTSGAGEAPQLIPHGTLSFATFSVKELKKSARTGGQYARVELALVDGQFHGRKIWSIVMDPFDSANINEAKRAEGKPDGAKMGLTALTRMLEASGIFNPAHPQSYRVYDARGFTDILNDLSGQRVAIKVKIAKGEDGYDDKNEVAEYLSPNPESGGHKGWLTLNGGANATAQARSSFGTTTGPVVHPRPAAAPSTGAPAWLAKSNPNPSNEPF